MSFGRARAELLRARLAARPSQGRDGRLVLLDAARRLEPLDARLAREAYREAFGAALTAGRLGLAGGMTQVAEAIRAASGSRSPRAADLLLDGLAALVTDGHRVGAPMLKRAVRAFRDEAVPAPDALRWLPFACQMSRAAWDDESWHLLSARLIELARQAGALTALPDALIEAAARTGTLERASNALRRLSEATTAAATDWALGIQARSRALLSGAEHAEHLYLEAIERLGRTRIRAELARAHLLYGEWLRRQGRRRDAREQLRTAHQMLDTMGIAGFAERARTELLATGETARKRTIGTVDDLTAQETHIARLACNGRSNPEISTELFLSPRTVEWHLRKIFTKLGISSRKELCAALPDLDLVSGSP